MARFWAITVLGFAAFTVGFTHAGGTKDKNFEFKGKLTKDDPKDQRGGPSQVHAVKLKAGKAYTIDMISGEMDSYLRLLDNKGAVLAEDDDSGGGLNAQIVFNCTKDGEYKLVSTTFGASNGGSYILTVKTAGAVQQPSTAHARMIGKDAPDFQADFTLNGKARKLADLEGKVVLLDFCDVRAAASVAMLPRLNEWHKAYQAKGLAIVSVTFYPTDINRTLAFNAGTGTIRTVEKADRKSDRALLAAFASYHKIAHPMMALPKEEALDAFNAYAVNGLPQLVLIDRKGIVRLVDVSGEKGNAAVEAAFKKLLAEK